VPTFRFPLIAFTGFARCGKDEAAQILIAQGFNRVCFGDLIKAQLDPVMQKHLGFSAFTSDPVQKSRIRPVLEYWGDANWDNIFNEFFAALTPPAVNTRLCRVREAEEWVERGGIIVNVVRPGVVAETPWAEKMFWEMQNSGLLHSCVVNNSSVEGLHQLIREKYL
jgi:hypothetical protein